MAYQAGIADSLLHLAEILDRFLTGGGIPDETDDGRHFVPGTGNTGNGGVYRILGTASSVTETITITLTSSSAFNVAGSVSGSLGSGTVGTPFSSAVADFEVRDGTTAFVATDSFTFGLTQSPLVAAAPSQVWTKRLPSDAGTVGALNQKTIYEGPGLTGADAILVGIDTPSAPVGTGIGKYHFRLIGMTSFSGATAFYSQTGYSGANSPCMPGWSQPMPYWLVGDGASFALYTRVGREYSGCSAGFLTSLLANPLDWPYPLFLGGMNYDGWNVDYNNGSPSPWWTPCANVNGGSATSLKFLNPSSVWTPVQNWYGTGLTGATAAGIYHTWPYTATAPSLAEDYHRQGWGGNISGPKGEQVVMPILIYGREGAAQGPLASLPHMYYCTAGERTASNTDVNSPSLTFSEVGFFENFLALRPEDEILVGSERFKLFSMAFSRQFRNKSIAALRLV